MTNSFVQVAPDDTGKKIQTFSGDVVGNTVHAQAVVLVDTSGTPITPSILVATVTLTDEQIKALPTTGVEIVTAQGSNTVISPVSAIVILDASAGAYVADADASWNLMLGDKYLSGEILAQSTLQSLQPRLVAFPIPGMYATDDGHSPDFATEIVPSVASNIETISDQPLKIKDDFQGVDDYTGGHADNWMKVVVHYTVIDTSGP